MSRTVWITKGLPGSGKSTWAIEQVRKSQGGTKRVNKDDLRAMLDGGKWSKGNEKFVLLMRDQIVLEALRAGKHVIVDDTNLNPVHETDIQALVANYISGEVVVKIKDFTDVSLEKCIERDLTRPNSVGYKVIMDMHKKWLAPKQGSPVLVPHNPDLPNCIICDIDGTLADNNWRNPFDASEADKDGLIGSTNRLLTMVRDLNHLGRGKGASIILFSGRDGSFLEPTIEFLRKHNVPYSSLTLRAEGDTRKDSIVKREMYDKHIEGKYNVLFVLDDRDQVVDMWRSLGLPCHQVNYGDF